MEKRNHRGKMRRGRRLRLGRIARDSARNPHGSGGGNGCGIKRKTQCARDGNKRRAFTENAGKRGRNHSLRRRACARKSEGRRKGGHRALLNKTGGG